MCIRWKGGGGQNSHRETNGRTHGQTDSLSDFPISTYMVPGLVLPSLLPNNVVDFCSMGTLKKIGALLI